MTLDLEPTLRLLTDAADHYEKSAPTVCEYVNDLYSRINERAEEVRLSELFFVGRLLEEGQWMQPNYAANQVYHLMSRLGMNVTGHAGF